MTLRSALLYEISRRRLPEAAERTTRYSAYQDWRKSSLSRTWSAFESVDLSGKDVLDFGCGDGALALFLAAAKSPASVIGVDLDASAIDRAATALLANQPPPDVRVDFRVGNTNALPVAPQSIDVIVAFDCLEHVMSPLPIFHDWFRVLRPGGRCLLEWYPFNGPWGPHMEALIPVPWAHVLFGQTAMFRAAERIYDHPQFISRHWDIDQNGQKRPNKWRKWSTFREQGYINELDIPTLRALVQQAGLQIARLERHSFSGSITRRTIGNLLMRLPVVGKYFISHTIIELQRP